MTQGLTGFTLSYFVRKHCSPSWRLEDRIFPMYDLVLILEGSARYWIDGREYRVCAGDFLCIRPGSRRAAVTTGMVCAAFDFSAEKSLLDELPVLSRYVRTDALDRLLDEFEYEWLQSAEGRDLKCAALFLLILHALRYGGELSGPNRHVEKIKRHIVENFAQPLRVRELAELAGLNAVYCGALFRRVEGVTIAEYTARVRVARAAALLADGACGVTEAAELCGFSDVYHFSRTFKKLRGQSPSSYGRAGK